MAQGLIAAALGGFGKALATVGEMEAKKQNEASLRKELMAAESEERLRIDEITRKRDIEGIGQKTEATARANLAAAPIVGQTSVVQEQAKFEAEKKGEVPRLRAESGVAQEQAKFEAEKKGEVPRLRAESGAAQDAAKFKARKDFDVDRLQAEADVDKRLAELNAEKTKGVTKLEAERNARIEREKYEAMLAAGVSEAKAKALMADYIAGDAQRKKQASDAIQAEIDATIKKGGNKDYLKAESKISVAKSAGDIAEIREREAGYRNRPDKDSSGKTTITELKTKLTVAEDRLATELGVPRAKINEATLLLQKKASRDAAAAKKLKDIESYRDEVRRAQDNISRWKDTGSDKGDRSGSGNKPGIESFNK